MNRYLFKHVLEQVGVFIDLKTLIVDLKNLQCGEFTV